MLRLLPTNIANMCIPISKPQLSLLVIVYGVAILNVQSNVLTKKHLMITSMYIHPHNYSLQHNPDPPVAIIYRILQPYDVCKFVL